MSIAQLDFEILQKQSNSINLIMTYYGGVISHGLLYSQNVSPIYSEDSKLDMLEKNGYLTPEQRINIQQNVSNHKVVEYVPEKVLNVVEYIKLKNSTPPNGYKGGKMFKNNGRDGGQMLPENTTYKEYDVNPYIKGQNRGAERIVMGEDG